MVRFFRNTVINIVVISIIITTICFPSTTLAATINDLGWPFAGGQTWFVYQGYYPGYTHVENSIYDKYAFDLVKDSWGNSCGSGNAEVLAPISGRTVVRDRTSSNLGWEVYIRPGDGYVVLLAHLMNLQPTLSDNIVEKGEAIGQVYNGFCPGNVNHLHFSIVKENESTPQGVPLNFGVWHYPTPNPNPIPPGGPTYSSGEWRGTRIDIISDILFPNGTITSPTDGNAITGSAFTVTSNASDNAGGSGVYRVEFKLKYNDTWAKQPICSVSTAPYICNISIDNISDQFINIAIDIIDRAGNRAVDAGGWRTYHLDRMFPNGNITAPTDGSATSGPTFTLTANAYDNSGGSGVKQVEFKMYVDGSWRTQPVCVATAAPYTCTIDTNNISDQFLTFAIDVIDRADNRAVGAGGWRTYHLDRMFPNGSIIAPTDGSSTSGPTFTLTANASDNSGGSGVKQVEFKMYVDGDWRAQPVCVATTAPYTCTIDVNNISDQYITFAIDIIDRAGNRAVDAGGWRTYHILAKTDQYRIFLPIVKNTSLI